MTYNIETESALVMDSTSQNKNFFSSVLNYFSTPNSVKTETDTMQNCANKKGFQASAVYENMMSSSDSSRGWNSVKELESSTQGLERAHRMSNEQQAWFSCDQRESLQPPPQFHPGNWSPSFTKQTAPSSHQAVFNVNRNCYESLPVSQTPYIYPNFYQQDLSPSLQIQEDVCSSSWGSSLVTNLMELVENSLLEMVCHQTRIPSPHRLAAETLAKSDLNPNAKEFKPQEKPEESDADESVEESDDDDHADETHTEFVLVGECFKNSDEFVIEPSNAGNHAICDFLIFPGASNEEEETDDSEDGDDDSDWWDSDDDTTGQCVDIDPSEFEDLFASPLMMSSLQCEGVPCQTSPNQTTCHPTSPLQEPNSLQGRTLEQINKTYLDQEESSSSSLRRKNVVSFCEDLNVVIEEPEEMSADLALARLGDFVARQADRERMERVLGPVLTPLHRQRVFSRLYE